MSIIEKKCYLLGLQVLRRVCMRSPHLYRCDSCKLSRMSAYAPVDLVWWMLAKSPSGSNQPPNKAQPKSIFRYGTILCCWAEPHPFFAHLFHGWEQNKNVKINVVDLDLFTTDPDLTEFRIWPNNIWTICSDHDSCYVLDDHDIWMTTMSLMTYIRVMLMILWC